MVDIDEPNHETRIQLPGNIQSVGHPVEYLMKCPEAQLLQVSY